MVVFPSPLPMWIPSSVDAEDLAEGGLVPIGPNWDVEERKWEGEKGRGCRVESRPLESKQVDSEPEAEGVVREGAKDKGSCKFEKMDDVLLELEGWKEEMNWADIGSENKNKVWTKSGSVYQMVKFFF